MFYAAPETLTLYTGATYNVYPFNPPLTGDQDDRDAWIAGFLSGLNLLQQVLQALFCIT